MAELVVVANGRIEGERRWEMAERRLRSLFGNQVEIRFTRNRGDATDLTRELLAKGASWIAVAGGDGTINEAVNGLFERGHNIYPESRLSFLPCGTANDWARTLGVPPKLLDAVDGLSGARERSVDVGIVKFPGKQGERAFVNFAETGAGAEVIRRLERAASKGIRRASYIPAAVLGAFSHQARNIRLRVDGCAPITTGPLISLIVAGGRYFGAGIRVAPMAEPDDGLLEVISIGNFSKAEIVAKIGKFARGDYFDETKVSHCRASELEISAETPLPVLLDGEIAGELPVRIRVIPRALSVRC